MRGKDIVATARLGADQYEEDEAQLPKAEEEPMDAPPPLPADEEREERARRHAEDDRRLREIVQKEIADKLAMEVAEEAMASLELKETPSAMPEPQPEPGRPRSYSPAVGPTEGEVPGRSSGSSAALPGAEPTGVEVTGGEVPGRSSGSSAALPGAEPMEISEERGGEGVGRSSGSSAALSAPGVAVLPKPEPLIEDDDEVMGDQPPAGLMSVREELETSPKHAPRIAAGAPVVVPAADAGPDSEEDDDPDYRDRDPVAVRRAVLTEEALAARGEGPGARETIWE